MTSRNGNYSIIKSKDIVLSLVRAKAVHKRTVKRVATFGENNVLFGMSAKTFQEYAYTNYGVTFTLDEAEKVRVKFFDAYPALQTYHKHIWNTYKEELQTSPLGLKGKPTLGTDAINYPVQSGIGETTKIALKLLVKKYPEALGYVFNIVHDAIYLRVPEKEAKIWAKHLAKAMKKAWEVLQDEAVEGLFKIKDIPMPVEVEYIDKEGKLWIKEY